MTGCVTHTLLLDFVAGRLESEPSATVAEHLAWCSTCQKLADALTDDTIVREFHRSHQQRNEAGLSAAEPLEVLGRFRLQRRLGSGAFGVVHLAEDTQLGRLVALKIPHAGALADPAARQRFMREVRAAAALHHPQIVALYDAGQCDGVSYLAAAYCSGSTLLQWLRERGGPASPDEAAKIVLAMAEAVQHAHEHGVLHRDIKPQNVLMDPATHYRSLPFCPKLTDFSVAKLMEDAGDATASHVLIGTPRYMAPEQVSGRRELVGPASDVYALGVLLYELMCGAPPIQGQDNADTLRRVLQDEPVAPRRRLPAIPRDLESICLKCLEKSPQNRYASAQALADDLERFLLGQPTRARPISSGERLARWVRRRPAAAALLLSAAAGAVIVVVGLVLYNERLNDFNVTLGKANAYLEQALQEARDAQRSAEQSDEKTQQLLYNADLRLAARAWKDGDTRTLLDLLSRHIPTAGHLDRRGLEWRFLWNLAGVKPQPIDDVGSDVYYLRLSPDGRRLAAVGKDAIVRLYDLATGTRELALETGQGEVNGVAFSLDGQRIATAGDDGTLRVWSLEDRRELLSIAAHPKLAFQVHFIENDAALVSCGNDPVVRLWDAHTGAALGALEGHELAVEAIQPTADGRWLASAGRDSTARVWDLPGRRELHKLTYTWRKHHFSSLAWSPDGQWLATGDLNLTVCIWHVASGRLAAVGQHLHQVHSVAFSPKGNYLASGDARGMACLWDAKPLLGLTAAPDQPIELKPIRQWPAHEGHVHSVLFERDDRLLSAAADGRIQSWSLSSITAAPSFSLGVTGPDLRWPTFVADGQLIAGGHRVLSCFLTPQMGEFELLAPSELNPALISVDGSGTRLATFDRQGAVEVCHLVEGRRRSWNVGQEPAGMSLSPEGSLLAVAVSEPRREVRLYDSDAGRLLRSVALTEGSVKSTVFSPDGRRLAINIDNDVLLWRVADLLRAEPAPAPLRITTGHVSLIAFNPDSSLLATGGSDRLVKFWDPSSGAWLATLAGQRGGITSVCFSLDGRSLVTAGEDGALKVWSVASREELFDLYQHDEGGLRELQISPDGRRLACGTHSHGRILLFDLGELP
jgi:WD40 repeat protein